MLNTSQFLTPLVVLLLECTVIITVTRTCHVFEFYSCRTLTLTLLRLHLRETQNLPPPHHLRPFLLLLGQGM